MFFQCQKRSSQKMGWSFPCSFGERTRLLSKLPFALFVEKTECKVFAVSSKHGREVQELRGTLIRAMVQCWTCWGCDQYHTMHKLLGPFKKRVHTLTCRDEGRLIEMLNFFLPVAEMLVCTQSSDLKQNKTPKPLQINLASSLYALFFVLCACGCLWCAKEWKWKMQRLESLESHGQSHEAGLVGGRLLIVRCVCARLTSVAEKHPWLCVITLESAPVQTGLLTKNPLVCV